MPRSMNKTALAVAIAALSAFVPCRARADIPIANAKGWSVSMDGRLDTFFSFAWGDGLPKEVAGITYEGIYDFTNPSGTLTKTRIRSGFLTNLLGFSVKKQLTPDVLVTGRFGTWVGVSQSAAKADVPAFDERELYIKIDAPWGGLLAGRNLSLFGRGAILVDYDVLHGYGMGSPCSIQIAQGGACGFAGFGILFPGYNAGVVYNTPVFGGFQISGGAFDPSALVNPGYQRTPYPRVEGEATFEVPKYFKASASGQWQKIGQSAGPLLVDASGMSFSAALTLGPLQVGGAGFFGQGLGIYQAMEDSPLFSDQQGVLRHQNGVMGLAALTFGDTKIGGGVGATHLLLTKDDSPNGGTAPIVEGMGEPIPAQQLGISIGVYQRVMDLFVVALEYFRADITWHAMQDSMNNVTTPKQDVDFVNGGITMTF
jgi:hypothetical protein